MLIKLYASIVLVFKLLIILFSVYSDYDINILLLNFILKKELRS